MLYLGVALLGAGDTIFVGETLKSMGIAGAIIIVLMGVITLLGGIIAIQWKHANKVYGYRLAERDTLNAALNESKTAVAAMAVASKERNDITDEMAEVIAKQAHSFDALSDRIRMHYERLIDDNTRLNFVVSSLSESARIIVGQSTDIKTKIESNEKAIAAVNDVLDELRGAIVRPRPTRK